MSELKKRMLVAEDKNERFNLVEGFVDKAVFTVTRTFRGSETYDKLKNEDFDIAVLDLHLMDSMSGQDVIRAIRRLKPQLPIVAMTDESGDPAVAECLALGANDCLVAPFSRGTFMARVKTAIWHCSFMGGESVIEWGDVSMDLEKRTASYCGQSFPLSDKEYALLQPLIRKQGGVIPSNELERIGWGSVNHMSVRLEHALSKLRQKFVKCNAPQDIIDNHKGVGYALTV